MQNILHTLLFKEFISPCDQAVSAVHLFREVSLRGIFSSWLAVEEGEESSTTDKNRFGEEEEYRRLSWKNEWF